MNRMARQHQAAAHAVAAAANPFLTEALPKVFLRTAFPIVLIMAMNGLFTVVDAAFLGRYVGADALAAVTLIFPLSMLVVALASLVSLGMASVLARHLGAGRAQQASRSFVGAHALVLLVCALLVALFAVFGRQVISLVANGSVILIEMGWTYLAISVFCSPLLFVLSLQGDALRSEGKLQIMALVAVSSSLANMALNYFLIVLLGWGVAGSAAGTVLAQAAVCGAIWVYRTRVDSPFAFRRLRGLWRTSWRTGWGEFLALGAPQCLNFLGISLVSAAVILSLGKWSGGDYEATVGAYGVITRIMTFAFMPLMGINLAFQTIVGNNFGAKAWARSDASLRLALGVALAYCAGTQLLLFFGRSVVTTFFVDDAAISLEAARILPIATAAYWTVGPMMILGGYFQAIGDARRAAVLGLARTYTLTLPLTWILPFFVGETGIWLAGPVGGVMMIFLVMMLLRQLASSTGMRWGLFRGEALVKG